MSISKIMKEGSSFNNGSEEVELVSFAEPDEINAQTFIKYNGVVLDATDTDAARIILKRLRTFDLNNIDAPAKKIHAICAFMRPNRLIGV